MVPPRAPKVQHLLVTVRFFASLGFELRALFQFAKVKVAKEDCLRF